VDLAHGSTIATRSGLRNRTLPVSPGQPQQVEKRRRGRMSSVYASATGPGSFFMMKLPARRYSSLPSCVEGDHEGGRVARAPGCHQYFLPRNGSPEERRRREREAFLSPGPRASTVSAESGSRKNLTSLAIQRVIGSAASSAARRSAPRRSFS